MYFIEPKKPLHLMWNGFFIVVDRRIELSNLIHRDLAAIGDYVKA
ncbi:hypothetical protein [Pontibacter harenae]|nr:hypothetical protein [Pontibacter harenae]